MNEELIERLKQKGFRVTKMTMEDLRIFLKSKGWRRHDRASGPNESNELWHAPQPMRTPPQGISLKAAVKRQLKADGYLSS
jgi:hypothetical protein